MIDMPIYFTIEELALGLLSWGLGLVSLLHQKKDVSALCSVGSLFFCAASLCVVVFDFAHLADIEDVSAFLDTANAFRLAAGVLFAGTLILNGSAMLRSRKRNG